MRIFPNLKLHFNNSLLYVLYFIIKTVTRDIFYSNYFSVLKFQIECFFSGNCNPLIESMWPVYDYTLLRSFSVGLSCVCVVFCKLNSLQMTLSTVGQNGFVLELVKVITIRTACRNQNYLLVFAKNCANWRI